MVSIEMLITDALKNNIRVNTTNKTVEIYDEFGVKLVLRNLSEAEYEAFEATYPNY